MTRRSGLARAFVVRASRQKEKDREVGLPAEEDREVGSGVLVGVGNIVAPPIFRGPAGVPPLVDRGDFF